MSNHQRLSLEQLEAISGYLQQLEPLSASPSLLVVRKTPQRLQAVKGLLELFAAELKANQLAVLERTLGEASPERLADIAVDLGVSRERAGAIAKQGLKRLIKRAREALTASSTPMRPAAAGTLALYQGDAAERALRFARLPAEDLRREAVSAASQRDLDRLWALTDAYLTLHGAKGTRVSERTRENYRTGLRDLLEDWSHENLLRPSRDAGVVWVRQLERRLVLDKNGEARRDPRTGELRRLSPSTIQLKLAAARALYKALRWALASKENPFENVQLARDPVPAWEKRGAYTPEEVEALLAQAEVADRVLVLLGAHAGLRIAEISRLRWPDIDYKAKELIVRAGKGGKRVRVAMTRRLREALKDLPRDAADLDGYVLPYRAYRARERFKRLCQRAGVAYQDRAVHGLRHGAGTRVYQQFKDLGRVAQHLRQASVDTARRYAKMADKVIHEGIEDW